MSEQPTERGIAAGSHSSSATVPVKLKVNGADYEFRIAQRVSLLDALREFIGLTGTKKGCNQGACGACTVMVEGERINSCFALAVQYEGREITTVEGLAQDGALHPLQAAFVECDGSSAATAHPARSVRPSGCLMNFSRICRAQFRPR